MILKSHYGFKPIAILCVLSMVLKKHLRFRISSYLAENNLLSERQSSFCAYHSCASVLLEGTENIRRELDEGKLNSLVLIDHSFEAVEDSLLLLKE